MHPLFKILNTPVMSLCLVKQNDGTWVEKHQRFLFNVYKRFFLFLSRFFLRFYRFLFFLERFFTSMGQTMDDVTRLKAGSPMNIIDALRLLWNY